jgi:hypothetical protein
LPAKDQNPGSRVRRHLISAHEKGRLAAALFAFLLGMPIGRCVVRRLRP